MDLQIYQEVFELEFLRETEAVYRAESLRMIRDPEFTVSLAICVLHGKATYGVCKYLNIVLCVCVYCSSLTTCLMWTEGCHRRTTDSCTIFTSVPGMVWDDCM